jgi:queuine tRNA-ribosyltransferase
MRQHILKDTFKAYYEQKREEVVRDDAENPKKYAKPPRDRIGGRARTLGNFELVQSPLGHWSVRAIDSGETMHSVSEPADEAKRLYVEQSRLAETLQERELVVWDVGLGAGTNALEAIRACEKEGLKKLHLVSFEKDLDAFRLALKHHALFPSLWHAAPKAILEKKNWKSDRFPIEWTLIEGDFAQTMSSAPAPDLIYFDPFSYKTDSPLWTQESFEKIRSHVSKSGAALFTYSASTAVRSSLLASGFYVAKGVGTGPKGETTIALVPGACNEAGDEAGNGKLNSILDRYELLDAAWLSKWERSSARVPSYLTSVQAQESEAKIRNHPQFKLQRTQEREALQDALESAEALLKELQSEEAGCLDQTQSATSTLIAT